MLGFFNSDLLPPSVLFGVRVLAVERLSRVKIELVRGASFFLFLGLIFVTNLAYAGASRGFCPECSVFLAENKTLSFRPSLRDRGDLIPKYYPPKHPDASRFDQGFYERLIDLLNVDFILPKDIFVVFKECGRANAFYNRADVQITMCHELVESVEIAFSFTEYSEQEFQDACYGTELFILMHEIGHALIDVLDIPITGKEEDAVDQFSTMLLIGSYLEDEALYAAEFFFRGAETDSRELPFWDEHSLDEQRFYNIVCWVYGSDPRAHRYLLREGILPKARAQRCVAEYKQLFNSWFGLTREYLKRYR